MVAHPGWILEKAVCKLSSKHLCSHLESPCSTRAALAVLGYLWFSAAETHRLSGSDEQRHSFLTTVISALLYHHFHQVTLPWSTCLAFHSFPSKARVSLTQVLRCYLLYTAWSHQTPPMSRDFHFHHSPLFFPGSAVTLPLKSYPFLEGVLPSPLLLNKCIFDENLHTSCRKLNMEITHKSSDLDMQWHSYPAQDRPKVKPQM